MRKTRDTNGARVLGGNVQRLVIEVFGIVLGVMLALAVNEWREQRTHRTQVEAALRNVAAELGANREQLTAIHANNTETLALLTVGGADHEDRQFVPAIQLKDTAWRTLRTTGVANHVDYETILTLSETYAIQDVYKMTGGYLLEAVMNMTGSAVVAGIEVDNDRFSALFAEYFDLLVGMEEQLLESFDEAEGHLGAIAPQS